MGRRSVLSNLSEGKRQRAEREGYDFFRPGPGLVISPLRG